MLRGKNSRPPPRSTAAWEAHIHPEDFGRTIAKFETAVQQTRVFDDEWRLLRRQRRLGGCRVEVEDASLARANRQRRERFSGKSEHVSGEGARRVHHATRANLQDLATRTLGSGGKRGGRRGGRRGGKRGGKRGVSRGSGGGVPALSDAFSPAALYPTHPRDVLGDDCRIPVR